jgi:glycosyltransferase involved in cell wall biosynthesis
MVNLVIVIPAYNEEQAIAETISEYRFIFPESRIVVVDNNSTDATAKKAFAVLDHDRDLLISEQRQGKGFAIKNALSRLEADIYLMTDADFTYPAKDAKLLLDEMLKSRADMLVGDRISGGTYDDKNARLGHGLGNRLLTNVISYLAGKRYRDVLSGLRLISRPYVSMIDVRSSGFQLETELNVFGAFIKADIIEIPIKYRQRGKDSHSKLNTIGDGMKILGFTLSSWLVFTPLQPFLIMAALMATISGFLSYRVISGFLNTGLPFTTTATAAVAAVIIATLSLFFGLTLKILVSHSRRKDIAKFLEAKRLWNSKLDESDI